MVRVGIPHPNKPVGRFDHECYARTHMKLVGERLRSLGLVSIEACRVASADDKAGTSAYTAMAHLAFRSEAALRASFAKHLEEMSADVSNYTNIEPLMMVTEIAEGCFTTEAPRTQR